jgi:Tfp pilus assembly protein FimT
MAAAMISQAPMLIKDLCRKPSRHAVPDARSRGFVLAEIVMVVFIIGLIVGLTVLNVSAMLGQSKSKAQAQRLAEALDRAGLAAAQTGRRFEVIVDIASQGYILREITGDNLSDVLMEEVVDDYLFPNTIRIKYVKFDDMQNETATDGQAKFRASRSGWQFGGKIVLEDSSGNAYSIIINRLTRTVKLANGDVEFFQPQDEMPF